MSESDITTAAYIFLLMGAIITFVSGLIVYNHKMSKRR